MRTRWVIALLMCSRRDVGEVKSGVRAESSTECYCNKGMVARGKRQASQILSKRSEGTISTGLPIWVAIQSPTSPLVTSGTKTSLHTHTHSQKFSPSGRWDSWRSRRAEFRGEGRRRLCKNGGTRRKDEGWRNSGTSLRVMVLAGMI